MTEETKLVHGPSDPEQGTVIRSYAAKNGPMSRGLRVWIAVLNLARCIGIIERMAAPRVAGRAVRRSPAVCGDQPRTVLSVARSLKEQASGRMLMSDFYPASVENASALSSPDWNSGWCDDEVGCSLVLLRPVGTALPFIWRIYRLLSEHYRNSTTQDIEAIQRRRN